MITIKLAGFTEDPPEPPATEVVLDFEPFEDPDDLSIEITTYEGFTFHGSAVVIETDEIEDTGRGPNGLVNGQTTVIDPDTVPPTLGQNVLFGGPVTEQIQQVDPETGEPVFDDDGNPVFDTVIIDEFGMGGRGSTFGAGDQGVLFTTDTSGQVFELPEELPEGVGESFNLEGLSLNVPQNDGVTVALTTYTLEIVEVPTETAGVSNYYFQYVEVDSFDFIVDASTPASQLNFETASTGGTTIDPAAFDGIYFLAATASDGNGVVLDDISIGGL